MKTLIQLVVVALIFGGISAAATIFLRPQTTATPVAGADADPAKKAEESEKGDSEKGDAHGSESADPDAADAKSGAETSEEKATEPVGEEALAAAEPPRGHVTPPPPAPASVPEQNAGGSAKPEAGTPRGEARVAVRPPYTPEGDEAGALINLLRERARTATETERKLTERQDALTLIFEDLRAEQARTLKIRQRLSVELKESRLAVDAARQSIETERSTLQKDQADALKAASDAVKAATEERDKLRKQLEKSTAAPDGDAAGSTEAGAPAANVNLKKTAAVFDGMAAENVAKVFEQLVKNKQIDTVVSFMNAMKDRQTAKVLGIITETNPQLAADLSDRLKRLKPPVDKPAAE